MEGSVAARSPSPRALNFNAPGSFARAKPGPANTAAPMISAKRFLPQEHRGTAMPARLFNESRFERADSNDAALLS